MGFEINRFFLMLSLCIFTLGCGKPDFDELEGPAIFYQVCPGKTDILRIRSTIDKGAPSIQLFDKTGRQLQKSTIVPMGGFMVTAMGNNSIQITYFIGQSDLVFFLPWFKENKSNPSLIGKYSIHYNYEIRNKYSETEGSEIDSLHVDKKAQATSLFLKGKLVTTRPTYLLILKSSELVAYDVNTKSHTSYPFVDNDLADGYLKKILDMYDTSDN